MNYINRMFKELDLIKVRGYSTSSSDSKDNESELDLSGLYDKEDKVKKPKVATRPIVEKTLIYISDDFGLNPKSDFLAMFNFYRDNVSNLSSDNNYKIVLNSKTNTL